MFSEFTKRKLDCSHENVKNTQWKIVTRKADIYRNSVRESINTLFSLPGLYYV